MCHHFGFLSFIVRISTDGEMGSRILLRLVMAHVKCPDARIELVRLGRKGVRPVDERSGCGHSDLDLPDLSDGVGAKSNTN